MTSDDLPHQVKTKDREREERVKEFQRQRDAVQRERARLQVIACDYLPHQRDAVQRERARLQVIASLIRSNASARDCR